MTFKDQGTADIYNGDDSKAARKTLPQELHENAAKLLDRVAAIGHPTDLRIPRNLNLHKLTGSRDDQWAIRINDQFRICFYWNNDEATDIEITDYHDEKR